MDVGGDAVTLVVLALGSLASWVCAAVALIDARQARHDARMTRRWAIEAMSDAGKGYCTAGMAMEAAATALERVDAVQVLAHEAHEVARDALRVTEHNHG